MCYVSYFRLVALALALLAIAERASAQVEYRYAFLRLPALGAEDSFGEGINETGLVVGSAFLPGNVFHATLWVDEEPFDLGTLGGSDSSALAINTDGWVVGWSRLPNGRKGAFLWRDDRMENIGTLGGDGAQAESINELNEIVGWSEVVPGQGSPQRAFLWREGQMMALPNFEPDRGSSAADINDSGSIVGSASITHPRYPQTTLRRPALWRDGQIFDLGSLDPESQAVATAINNLGHIVGYATLPHSSREHAVIWANGRIYDLGTPGTRESLAYDINNLGQVVGIGYTEFSLFKGFLWEQGRGMQRLDDLAPPRLRGVGAIDTGWEINDAGQIAGTAHPPGDPISGIGFLMSPVSPSFEMDAPQPGRAGEANTLTVSNCTPGARVVFLFSRFGGGQRIPGCDLQQNALQLDSPTVIGTAIADGSGVATITRTVPPIARGQTILFQAVVQNECAISQLVVHAFE